jgi:hypothetical protein
MAQVPFGLRGQPSGLALRRERHQIGLDPLHIDHAKHIMIAWRMPEV